MTVFIYEQDHRLLTKFAKVIETNEH